MKRSVVRSLRLSASFRYRPPRILAVLFSQIGLVLMGGCRLLMLGRSRYYVVAGVAWMLSGALLWRGRRLASLLHGGMLFGTVVWALWEVGFDAWALLPRVLAPLVIGLWFLTSWLTHGPDARRPSPGTFIGRHPAAARVFAVCVAAATFIAAPQGDYLRAFHLSTSKQLWQGRLAAAGLMKSSCELDT